MRKPLILVDCDRERLCSKSSAHRGLSIKAFRNFKSVEVLAARIDRAPFPSAITSDWQQSLRQFQMNSFQWILIWDSVMKGGSLAIRLCVFWQYFRTFWYELIFSCMICVDSADWRALSKDISVKRSLPRNIPNGRHMTTGTKHAFSLGLFLNIIFTVKTLCKSSLHWIALDILRHSSRYVRSGFKNLNHYWLFRGYSVNEI
jgi:hypothetical protein